MTDTPMSAARREEIEDYHSRIHQFDRDTCDDECLFGEALRSDALRAAQVARLRDALLKARAATDAILSETEEQP